MIQILEFDRRPILAGQSRHLIFGGDGPFRVTTSCFVENPPPPGFRGCWQCETKQVASGEAVKIKAGWFWRNKNGRIDVKVVDSAGETLHLSLSVVPNVETTPGAAAAV